MPILSSSRCLAYKYILFPFQCLSFSSRELSVNPQFESVSGRHHLIFLLLECPLSSQELLSKRTYYQLRPDRWKGQTILRYRDIYLEEAVVEAYALPFYFSLWFYLFQVNLATQRNLHNLGPRNGFGKTIRSLAHGYMFGPHWCIFRFVWQGGDGPCRPPLWENAAQL
jgi:hypothetical protein